MQGWEGGGGRISARARDIFARRRKKKGRSLQAKRSFRSIAPNPVDPSTPTPSISLHPVDRTVMRLKRLARIGVVCRCKMGSGCLPWH